MLSKHLQSLPDQKLLAPNANLDQDYDRPYISFVVVARNDDHGGNFLKRMHIFISALCEQSIKHNLKSELIIVDWNPPNDSPKLAQVVNSWLSQKTLQNTPCKIRVIEVPPEIHQRFQHSDKLMLFQMIGKNVGIRRARGDYVIATNIDLLFSDELLKSFCSKSLKSKFFYRIDRYDVDGFPPRDSINEQLEYCKQNVIRINRKDGTFLTTNNTMIFFIKCGLAIQHTSNYYINRLISNSKYIRKNFQFVRISNHIYLKDKKRNKNLSLHEIPKIILRVTKDEIITMKRDQIVVLRRIFSLSYPKLHTNACGDFTLMKTEKWHELRGYLELETFSLHLDSIILQMAYESGLKEKILADPMRMYHMEHYSGWTPESGDNLLKRLSEQNIPVFSFKEFEKLSTKMHKQKRPIISNKDNWGLSSENLPEIIIN